MNNGLTLTDHALKLDPLNMEARHQFWRHADALLDCVKLSQREELADRISVSIQMLALAGISGEAPVSYRAELIAASSALDHESNSGTGPPNGPRSLLTWDPISDHKAGEFP